LIDVTVISTEQNLAVKHPDWIHLEESAYFSAQWNKAVELFSSNIFFQIQADARFNDFERLFEKVTTLFETGRVGVYEPNIDVTAYEYDKSKLLTFAENIYEVPLTDSICWFIAADIVLQLPVVDLSVNRYGWGICAAIAALARLNKKVSVRDYTFTVDHPPTRGYPTEIALKERQNYVKTLPPELAKEIKTIYLSPALPKKRRSGL
jgi:hypothetical protein